VVNSAWSFTPTSPLSNASHTISATQAAAGGPSSTAATDTFTVALPTAPATPTITSPANGSTDTTTAKPAIAGTGVSGDTVTVSIDGTVAGAAPVVNSAWSFTPTSPLSNASHTISATQAAAGGPSSTAATDTFTVAVSNGGTAQAEDGYISGATVFADANGTGQFASNDVSTTTDANGNFTLTGGTGPLIAFGGSDISTGLVFKGQLDAPSGSTIINPLTTLISGLQQAAGLAVAAAEQEVLAVFGLASSTNLTTLDPIAGAKGGDTDSAEAYAAGAKVIDTADAIASAFETAGKSFLASFEDAYAALESDIRTLAAGQSLSLTDQNTITALINSVAKTEDVNASSFVSTLSANIGASNASIDEKLAQDGATPGLITDVSTVQAAIQSSTFYLTKGVDAIDGGPVNNTIIAASNTATAGDQIEGGTGSNTLALEGPGTFNLTLPTTLTGVTNITAEEGQAAYSAGGRTFAAQNQIVVLRPGLDATINVEQDANLNPNNPDLATITIVGAANSDTINLASGNDVVTVGGPNEMVNLGAGNDTINVNAATIGATIGNGTGQNTLDVTGGGTMAMGANIVDISRVLLASASTAYHFTANAISGLITNDASTSTSDSLIAGGADQILTGGGAGKVAFTGSSAGYDTFKDTSALFNHDTLAGFGDNGDVIDLTDMNAANLEPLSWSQNTSSSGTLTVSDGVHMAAITLLGQYMANAFHPVSDGGIGTAITYHIATEMQLTTPPCLSRSSGDDACPFAVSLSH
jgi:hypothetical protein